jgi:hypothetical protein
MALFRVSKDVHDKFAAAFYGAASLRLWVYVYPWGRFGNSLIYEFWWSKFAVNVIRWGVVLHIPATASTQSHRLNSLAGNALSWRRPPASIVPT